MTPDTESVIRTGSRDNFEDTSFYWAKNLGRSQVDMGENVAVEGVVVEGWKGGDGGGGGGGGGDEGRVNDLEELQIVQI